MGRTNDGTEASSVAPSTAITNNPISIQAMY